MIPFRLTAKAKWDLKRIAIYTIHKWGRAQRNIYLKQLDDIFLILSDAPGLGATCDYIKSGYKKFPQGSHVIYYKIGSSSKIEVIRILHKRIDVSANFDNP